MITVTSADVIVHKKSYNGSQNNVNKSHGIFSKQGMDDNRAYYNILTGLLHIDMNNKKPPAT